MNLHGIVVGAIAVINPLVKASIQVSTGWTTQSDGKRIPSYADPVRVMAQVQPLTWRDIQMIDGLNLQGTRRKIYINGNIDGLVRPTQQGGDLVTIEEGVNAGVWLVALVAESWPDWCSTLCTLQSDSPT